MVFCVDCKFYRRRLFRPSVCRRFLERDVVTGRATKTYEREVREARAEDCKGDHYEFNTALLGW